jgi:hypothetical protein
MRGIEPVVTVTATLQLSVVEPFGPVAVTV